MTVAQMSLDLAGRPSGRVILDRIRSESRDESEKGRWFEQLFMRIALQELPCLLDSINRSIRQGRERIGTSAGLLPASPQ